MFEEWLNRSRPKYVKYIPFSVEHREAETQLLSFAFIKYWLTQKILVIFYSLDCLLKCVDPVSASNENKLSACVVMMFTIGILTHLLHIVLS